MKPNNAQNQRDEFTPVEIMDVQYQSIADNVASPVPNCTPIVLPPKLKQDGTIHIENEENTGTTADYCFTSIDNSKTDEEYENLFNFLLSNEREERIYTVECIRIHKSTKTYGG